MNNNIIEQYYNEHNFPSAQKLYKLLKDDKHNITQKEIKSYLDTQLQEQLMKQQNEKRKDLGHITAIEENEKWQMDIFDLSKYANSNNGYKYLLVIIDVFTRKAYVEPMKTKSIDDTTSALEKIINHIRPFIIISDNDSSFLGEKFQTLLDKYKIIHNTNIIGDHHALGIIDSFAKKLKTIISKLFIKNKNSNWINHINEIIRKYNNTPHSGILDLKPNEVTKSEKTKGDIYILNLNKSKKNATISDLSKDDTVRLKIEGTFKKGTEPKWSDEIYNVEEVRGKSIKLSNGQTKKRSSLLKVQPISNQVTTNIIKQTNINNSVIRKNRDAGIDQSNLISSKRIPKPKKILDV